MEKLLTVDEVAEYLQVHPMTIRRMIWDGELPAVHVAKNRVRIRQEDVETHLRPIAPGGAV